MVRELNLSILKVGEKAESVIGMTMHQVSLIFKKCMLIDEDDLQMCTNPGSTNLKSFVASLGSFVGTLTLSKNEPIRHSQLDLKQILIEGMQVKNRKLAVVFVCRILKETQHSRVFNLRNPWANTLLMILREISQLAQGQNEIGMEIESLFKTLNVQNPADIKPHGILESLTKPASFSSQAVRKELEYFHKKIKMILPAQAAPPPISS